MRKKVKQRRRTKRQARKKGRLTLGRNNPYTKGSPLTVEKTGKKNVHVRQKTVKEMINLDPPIS